MFLIRDAILNSNQEMPVTFDCRRERKAHTFPIAVDPNFLEVDLSCAYPSPNYECDE